MFDRHLVEQDSEDALLHLPGVFGTQDDHFFFGEVDGHRGGRGHASGEAVGGKGAGVVDDIVGAEMLELLSRRTDEHVPHKQGVICAGADDADVDAIPFVPSCEAVNDIDAIAGVEIVDGSFAIDAPDLSIICQ